ncbi:hypothetical protein GWK47_021567 [Chionoecetes opilio]|uniref:Uncharacterized protein n=1 Tax=Chionoecetes opilio TaxID=41210 RepID=A0A8J5CGQ7_CHIOP|nr:hypothetical protein GWK47_021567 [Chionoecetes opilio]
MAGGAPAQYTGKGKNLGRGEGPGEEIAERFPTPGVRWTASRSVCGGQNSRGGRGLKRAGGFPDAAGMGPGRKHQGPMCLGKQHLENPDSKEGGGVHIMKHVKGESAPSLPGPHVPRASGGRSIPRLLGPRPSPAPRSSCSRGFVKWWPLAKPGFRPNRSNDPVDGADKIIATCHALL